MTIEYTYQSRPPVGATIKGKNRAYSISSGEVLVWIGDDARSVEKADVPEVCEAMMRLAGHEWPDPRLYPSQMIDKRLREAAERIIARLQERIDIYPQPRSDLEAGLVGAFGRAQQFVREECGLPE